MAVNIFDKLNKEIDNNKLSHAYLIETNNCDACLNDLKAIIKRICCQNEYSNNCDKCNICHVRKIQLTPPENKLYALNFIAFSFQINLLN